MRQNFTTFNAITGRIATSGVAQSIDTPYQAEDGNDTLFDVRGSARTQFVDVNARTLVARPVLSFDKTSIAADDVEEAVLSGLPEGAVVLIDDVEYATTGGSISISSAMPATYRVVVRDSEAFPAQAFEGEIVAT